MSKNKSVDIKQRIKKTPINTSWFTNVAKSMGFTSMDVIKEIMPISSDFVDVNAQDTIQFVQDLRKNITSRNMVGRQLKQIPQIEMGKNALKNTLEDIKSGNIYNKDRLYSQDSFDISFDDDGDDDIFGDFEIIDDGDDDNIIDDDNGDTNVTINKNNSVKNVIDMMPLANVVASSTAATVEAIDAIATQNRAFSTEKMLADNRLLNVVSGGISSINDNMGIIVQFHSDSTTKYYAASIKFYEDYLKAFEEKMGPKKNKVEDSYANLLSSPYSSQGVLRFDKYKDVIKRNLETLKDDNSSLSQLSQIFKDTSVFNQFVKNPLGTLMTASIKKAINPMTKELLGNFDRSIHSIIPALTSRINRFEDSNSTVLKYLYNILNTNVKYDNKVKLGEYYKGDMPWNGISDKTLNEVIPSYLRRIESAITGMPERIFDQNTGKFTDIEEIKKSYDRELRLNEISGYTAFTNKVNSITNKMNMDYEVINQLNKDLEEYYSEMTKKGSLINPFLTTDANGSIIDELSDFDWDDTRKAIFRAVLSQVDKKSLTELGSSMIYDSRVRSNSFMDEIRKNPHKYNYNLINNNSLYNDKGKLLYDYSETPLFGNKDETVDILSDIMLMLTRGIVVFPKYDIDNPNIDMLRKHNDYEKNRKTRKENHQKRINKDKETKFKRQTTVNDVGSKEWFETLTDEEIQQKAQEAGELARQTGQKSKSKNPVFRFFQDKTSVLDDRITNMIDRIDDLSFKIMFGNEINNDMDDGELKEYLLNKIATDENKNKFGGIVDTVKDTFKGVLSYFTGKEYIGSDGNKIQIKDGLMGKMKDSISKLFGKIKNGDENSEKKPLMARVTDNFMDGFKQFKIMMFGEKGVNESDMKETISDLTKKVKDRLPKSIAKGAVNATIKTAVASKLGLLGGLILPGGPIGAMLVGTSYQFLRQSETFNKWLFGEQDAEGNRLGGFIPKSVQDMVKRHSKSIKIGGAVGAGVGLLPFFFLPGGPITGSLLGAGMGIVSKTENFQKMLFGDNYDDKENRSLKNGKFVKFFKDKLPKEGSKINPKLATFLGGSGALVGIGQGIGLLPSFLLPGGPIMGAMLGLAGGIMASSDKFQQFLFGEKEVDGKRYGGLMTKFTNWFQTTVATPFKLKAGEISDKMLYFVEDKVIEPFKNMFEPLTQAFKFVVQDTKDKMSEVWGNLTNGVIDAFNTNVVKPFGEKLEKYVVNPLKKLFNTALSAVGKVLGLMVSLPIKLTTGIVGGVANKFNKRHVRKSEMKKNREEHGFVRGTLKTWKNKKKSYKENLEYMSDEHLQKKYYAERDKARKRNERAQEREKLKEQWKEDIKYGKDNNWKWASKRQKEKHEKELKEREQWMIEKNAIDTSKILDESIKITDQVAEIDKITKQLPNFELEKKQELAELRLALLNRLDTLIKIGNNETLTEDDFKNIDPNNPEGIYYRRNHKPDGNNQPGPNIFNDMRQMIFGGKDENGNIKDGLIPESLRDMVNDYLFKEEKTRKFNNKSDSDKTRELADNLKNGKNPKWMKDYYKAKLEQTKQMKNNSHEDGLDEVPEDNYQANLHEGEMVVPKKGASTLRKVADKIKKKKDKNKHSMVDTLFGSKDGEEGFLGKMFNKFTKNDAKDRSDNRHGMTELEQKQAKAQLDDERRSFVSRKNVDYLQEQWKDEEKEKEEREYKLAILSALDSQNKRGEEQSSFWSKLFGKNGLIGSFFGGGLVNTLVKVAGIIGIASLMSKLLGGDGLSSIGNSINNTIDTLDGKNNEERLDENNEYVAAGTKSQIIKVGTKKVAKTAVKNGETIGRSIIKTHNATVKTASKIKSSKLATKVTNSNTLSKSKQFMNKYLGKLKTATSKFINLICKKIPGAKATISCVENVFNFFTKNADTILKKFGTKIGKEIGEDVAKSIPVIGWIAQAGMTVYDATTGATAGNVANLFQVPEDAADAKMRLISSAIQSVANFSWLGIIWLANDISKAMMDVSFLGLIAKELYKSIGDGDVEGKLESKLTDEQKSSSTSYNDALSALGADSLKDKDPNKISYKEAKSAGISATDLQELRRKYDNEKNGTSLSSSAYADKKNPLFLQRAWNTISSPFKKIGNLFKKEDYVIDEDNQKQQESVDYSNKKINELIKKNESGKGIKFINNLKMGWYKGRRQSARDRIDRNNGSKVGLVEKIGRLFGLGNMTNTNSTSTTEKVDKNGIPTSGYAGMGDGEEEVDVATKTTGSVDKTRTSSGTKVKFMDTLKSFLSPKQATSEVKKTNAQKPTENKEDQKQKEADSNANFKEALETLFPGDQYESLRNSMSNVIDLNAKSTENMNNAMSKAIILLNKSFNKEQQSLTATYKSSSKKIQKNNKSMEKELTKTQKEFENNTKETFTMFNNKMKKMNSAVSSINVSTTSSIGTNNTSLSGVVSNVWNKLTGKDDDGNEDKNKDKDSIVDKAVDAVGDAWDKITGKNKSESAGSSGLSDTDKDILRKLNYSKNTPSSNDYITPTNNTTNTTNINKSTNKMVFYSQRDGRWSDNLIGNKTMKDAGCGPTSIAMALSQVTGKMITPDTIAALGRDELPGYSTFKLFPEIADKLNMNYNETSTNYIDFIKNNLRKGLPVVLSGKSNTSKSPFTREGHIVTATRFDGDKIYIQDPKGKEFSKYYNFSDIIPGLMKSISYSPSNKLDVNNLPSSGDMEIQSDSLRTMKNNILDIYDVSMLNIDNAGLDGDNSKQSVDWGYFCDPSKGSITSYFGEKRSQYATANGNHGALDYNVHYQPLYAPKSGKVYSENEHWTYGNSITVKTNSGNMYYRLAHLKNKKVKKGDNVKQGQNIGTSGNTGHTFGPHVHFEILSGGTSKSSNGKDPLNYYSETKSSGKARIGLKGSSLSFKDYIKNIGNISEVNGDESNSESEIESSTIESQEPAADLLGVFSSMNKVTQNMVGSIFNGKEVDLFATTNSTTTNDSITETSASSGNATNDEFNDAVYVGDSIVVGFKSTNTIPSNRVYAKAGDTVQKGLSSGLVDKAISKKPPVMITHYGTNDAGWIGGGSHNIDWFKTQYGKLISKVKSKSPNTKLILTQAFTPTSGNYKKWITPIQDVLPSIASENGVTLVDSRSIDKSSYRGKGDPIHPISAEFYKKWVSDIKNKIVTAGTGDETENLDYYNQYFLNKEDIPNELDYEEDDTAGGSDSNSSTSSTYPTSKNGYAYYSQADPQWNKSSINGASVKVAGCGPTSHAMMLTTMFGKQITPYNMAKWARNKGVWSGSGMSWGMPDKVKDAFKLKIEKTFSGKSSNTLSGIKSELKAGHPVIMSGRAPDRNNDTPFTPKGHIVLGVGVDGSGNIIINDPRSADRSKAYTDSGLKRGIGLRAGWAFSKTDSSSIPNGFTVGGDFTADGTVSTDNISGSVETVDLLGPFSAMNKVAQNMVASIFNGKEVDLFATSTISDDTTTSDGNTTVRGANVAEQIYNYCLDEGCTPATAAGVVGNAERESNLQPDATNGSIGLFQWLMPQDQKELKELAKKMGKDWATVDVQMKFLWNDLKDPDDYNSYIFDKKYGKKENGKRVKLSGVDYWKKLTDPKKAARIFNECYERSADKTTTKRENFAQKWYDKFNNGGTGFGDINQFNEPLLNNDINNIVESSTMPYILNDWAYYSQKDPRWNTEKIMGTTVGEAGCGPTSHAMMLTTMFGKQINPLTITKWGAKQKDYYGWNSSGMQWGMPENIAKTFGLNLSKTFNGKTDSTIDEIKKQVKSGHPVVLSGKAPDKSVDTPFTPNGHIVLAVGVDGNNNLIINDPRSADRSKAYTDSGLKRGIGLRAGWAFAKTISSNIPKEINIDGDYMSNIGNDNNELTLKDNSSIYNNEKYSRSSVESSNSAGTGDGSTYLIKPASIKSTKSTKSSDFNSVKKYSNKYDRYAGKDGSKIKKLTSSIYDNLSSNMSLSSGSMTKGEMIVEEVKNNKLKLSDAVVESLISMLTELKDINKNTAETAKNVSKIQIYSENEPISNYTNNNDSSNYNNSYSNSNRVGGIGDTGYKTARDIASFVTI